MTLTDLANIFNPLPIDTRYSWIRVDEREVHLCLEIRKAWSRMLFFLELQQAEVDIEGFKCVSRYVVIDDMLCVRTHPTLDNYIMVWIKEECL